VQKELLSSSFVDGFITPMLLQISIPTNQVILQTQILRSRGFDEYMTDILFIQMLYSGYAISSHLLDLKIAYS